ncbi:ATP-dependent DNA helicase [Thermanaeromonas toyohensis]|uniref:ATP-dependent DNA helicase n=1 Tax=Thermanaeromonas toyohensis TaxID=161154 RepID=UPI00155FE9E7|nr:AAA family ATPase [Thermanaeromonas toyohensis]
MSAAETLSVRVISVPRRLEAGAEDPGAWGKFYIFHGPRKGEEYLFTGPVLEVCKLIKPNILAVVRGEFVPCSIDRTTGRGFYVHKAGDFVVAPDPDVLATMADITGVPISFEEFSSCLGYLKACSLQEARCVLEASPDRIDGLISAVGAELANKFLKWIGWERKWGADQLEGLFQACGLENELDYSYVWSAAKALRFRASRRGVNVADLVREHPYVLSQVWDDDGLTRQVIKAVLRSTGCSDWERAKEMAAVAAVQLVKREMDRGHSFTWKERVTGAMLNAAEDEMPGLKRNDAERPELLRQVWDVLHSSDASFLHGGLRSEKDGTNISFQEIARETEIVPKNNKFIAVYATGVYFAEKKAAERLADVVFSESNIEIDEDELLEQFTRAATEEGCKPDQEQLDFARSVARNRVTVLVGEAGSGKTKAVRWLVNALNRVLRGYHAPVLAPTALAAYRAARKTTGDPSTIHRFVRFLTEDADVFIEDPSGFEEGSGEYALPLVVVDESSMLGPVLLRRLLWYCGTATRYVFAGDPVQLPPVGPGGTFNALIRLAREGTPGFSLVELTQNHRVAQGSEIYDAARRVRSGYPLPERAKGIDVIYAKSAAEAVEKCVEVVRGMYAKWPDAPGELLVLTPRRHRSVGLVGAEDLNDALAAAFGFSQGFAPGVPVVAVRNDYADRPDIHPRWVREKRHPRRNVHVFNGTPGVVHRVRGDELSVVYDVAGDFQEVWYTKEEAPYFVERAFAMTVHKAQGGQARNVVLVLLNRLADRSLLYTAVSRCNDEPAGIGRVVIITRPEFAEAHYARPEWAELAETEDAGDEAAPVQRPVLAALYHRVKREIGRRPGAVFIGRPDEEIPVFSA